jgi:hypothetical protein
LQQTLKDPQKMNAVASKIVLFAIQNAAEQKAGLEIKNPMTTQVVKAGEPIPTDLANKVKAGKQGLAAGSWEKTWLDAIVWTRSWEKSGSHTLTGLPTEQRNAILSQAPASTVKFTAEELKVLKELNIHI